VEGEYGGDIMYSCMKMENETCWNYSKNGGSKTRMKEGVNSTMI
jgi:hypothetical protein